MKLLLCRDNYDFAPSAKDLLARPAGDSRSLTYLVFTSELFGFFTLRHQQNLFLEFQKQLASLALMLELMKGRKE